MKTAIVILLVLLTSSSTFAQQEIPSVTITSSAEGLTIADTIPEGLVTIIYENAGESPLFPVLTRLNDDVTMEDFMGTVSQGPELIPTISTLKGGILVQPESSGTVVYNFTPGNYLLLNFAGEQPQMVNFTVEDSEDIELAEPEADITVGLHDFSFVIPAEIPAGEHIWEVENFGLQWHEMAFYPIDPDMSLEEVQAMLMEEESFPVFLWTPAAEGEKTWISVNLEPGTYAVACFLPDVSEESEGHTHLQDGMLHIITVVEEE